jgi:hypothetical protein
MEEKMNNQSLNRSTRTTKLDVENVSGVDGNNNAVGRFSSAGDGSVHGHNGSRFSSAKEGSIDIPFSSADESRVDGHNGGRFSSADKGSIDGSVDGHNGDAADGTSDEMESDNDSRRSLLSDVANMSIL